MWGERVRAMFGLALQGYPARLRDGIKSACSDLGLEDDGDLLARVDRGDAVARAALARALTIGETYFFREPHHFDLLRSKLLPEAEARGRRPVRLLSAACSSGEEAYAMAIVARQLYGASAQERVQVLGVDVNERAIANARHGVYRAWSLRGVAEEVRQRWFEGRPGEWSVKPEVRALVSFERRNLVDPVDALAEGSVDVVFCRNVLIYFDEGAVRSVLQMLAQALRPGGALVLGSAESGFLATAGLGAREVEDVWLHTKGDTPSVAPVHLPRASSSPPMLYEAPPRRRVARQGRPPSPRSVAAPPVPTPSPAPVEAAVTSAARCSDEGWALLASDPAGAGEQARRAILLDRTLAAAHVLAASAAIARSDTRGALRSLRHARRYLASTPPTDVVPGAGGATAGEMASYCVRLERALEGRPR